MKPKQQLVISLAILVIGLFSIGAVGFKHRVAIRDWWESRSATDLPPAMNRNEVVNQNANVSNSNVSNTNTINTNSSALPSAVNLKVAFTSQAPHANWDTDHGEFCEEAAVMMLGRYWQDRGISGPDDAEAALQLIKRWQVDVLGYYFDTTATETARILSEYYELKGVAVVKNPSADDIKRELAAGRPVIAAAAGRELGNPNFTPPGPIYHMLVIKGYTADGKFITNDPGTRKGADYVYDVDVLMGALHDWIPGTTRTEPRNGAATGAPVIIVVRGE